MKLFTKAIEKQLQAQYLQGSSFEQSVVVKIFNPYGSHTWYIMNQDPNDPDYLWGIVKTDLIETGSVLKSAMEGIRLTPFKLPLERDLSFKPMKAQKIWDELNQGRYV